MSESEAFWDTAKAIQRIDDSKSNKKLTTTALAVTLVIATIVNFSGFTTFYNTALGVNGTNTNANLILEKNYTNALALSASAPNIQGFLTLFFGYLELCVFVSIAWVGDYALNHADWMGVRNGWFSSSVFFFCYFMSSIFFYLGWPEPPVGLYAFSSLVLVWAYYCIVSDRKEAVKTKGVDWGKFFFIDNIQTFYFVMSVMLCFWAIFAWGQHAGNQNIYGMIIIGVVYCLVPIAWAFKFDDPIQVFWYGIFNILLGVVHFGFRENLALVAYGAGGIDLFIAGFKFFDLYMKDHKLKNNSSLDKTA